MQLSAFLVTLLAASASAHGLISAASGNAGGKGKGLGVTSTRAADTTIFRGAAGCGRTSKLGTLDVAAQVAANIQADGGLPRVTPGGALTMTVRQVNGDGAGPYACSIDTTGTGAKFAPMVVTTQVPGTNGRSSNGGGKDFPLVATVPAGTKCTGTSGSTTGVCIVRCQNPAGPFGGCVPVQLVAAAALGKRGDGSFA